MVVVALADLFAANRAPVALAFWPFAEVTLPLGWIILAALALGLMAGFLLHLPKHLRAHFRAKRAEKRIAELEAPKTP